MVCIWQCIYALFTFIVISIYFKSTIGIRVITILIKIRMGM